MKRSIFFWMNVVLMLCFFLALVLPATMVFAEISWDGEAEGGFAVHMKLSDNTVELDKWIDLDIFLESPSNYHANTGAMMAHLIRQTDFLSSAFTIDSEIKSPETSEGKSLQHIKFRFKAIRTGTFFITFMTISFVPKEDVERKAVKIASPLFQVRVEPLKFNDSEILPAPLMGFSLAIPIEMSSQNRLEWVEKAVHNSGERQASVFQQHALPWKKAVSLVFLLVIAGVIYISNRLGWNKQLLEPPPDVQTVSLKQLDDLNVKDLPLNQRFDEYYVSLTSIMRQYIEKKFQLNAPHLTTQEFLEQASQHPSFSPITQQRLQDFLDLADRVKFATYHPTLDECHQAFLAAQEFIQRSIFTKS